MNLNKIVLLILFSTSSILGQEISVTEVKVLEGFKPSIPGASRLNENATFADTITKNRSQVYKLFDFNLKSDYKLKPLAVAQVKDDKISELYSNKVSFGFGNFFASKASFIHNSKRSRNVTYGLIANHFANKYDLAKNSLNTINFYAKHIKPSITILANLDYERKTAFYYDKDIHLEENRFFRNRFAYTKLSLNAFSKERPEHKLKHNTNFFISDLNEFSENQIYLGTNLSKKINDIPYTLLVEFDNYFRYNNVDLDIENTALNILGFSPNARFNKYGFDFDVAFDVDFFIKHNSPSFYTNIFATKELVENVLLISFGLDHTEKKHTLKSSSDINPYLNSYGTNQTILLDTFFLQTLKITDIQELYFYIRNNLALGEVFEGKIAYGTVKNLAYFSCLYNESYNRFNIDYINVKQFHLNANYSKKINRIIDLNINLDYYNWNQNVYNKPSFFANFSAPINLRGKIKINPLIGYIGKRIVNDEKITPLPSYFYTNLYFYYFYSKQLSAYLELNNITNSKHDIWYGYRDIGFNGVFGLNFSF